MGSEDPDSDDDRFNAVADLHAELSEALSAAGREAGKQPDQDLSALRQFQEQAKQLRQDCLGADRSEAEGEPAPEPVGGTSMYEEVLSLAHDRMSQQHEAFKQAARQRAERARQEAKAMRSAFEEVLEDSASFRTEMNMSMEARKSAKSSGENTFISNPSAQN